MEKNSDIYYHKYIKYKKKYLEAKKMLGGSTAVYQSPPPRMSMPNYGYTSKTDRHYHKFYASFTRDVLECIWNEASIKLGLRGINPKYSGIYFEFDDLNYLTIHNDKGTNHKFHINQADRRNSLGLAISYDDYGNLEIVKKYKDRDFWDKVSPKFKDLLDIIERCVNSNKIEPIRRGPLDFTDAE